MINKLMISCEKATKLTEKGLNDTLNLSEKLRLHLHVKMCAVCLHYKQQQIWIDELIKMRSHNRIDKNRVEALKKQIIKKVAHE